MKAYVREGFAEYKNGHYNKAYDAYSNALNLTKSTDKEYKIYQQQMKLCKKKLGDHLEKNVVNKPVLPKINLFKCKVCDKTFTMIQYLKRHEIMHSNQKPFKCNYCDKAFKLRAHLTNHMRGNTHTDDQKRIYRKALGLSERKQMKTDTTKTVHKCTICNREFRQKRYLDTHLINVHIVHTAMLRNIWLFNMKKLIRMKDHLNVHYVQDLSNTKLD